MFNFIFRFFSKMLLQLYILQSTVGSRLYKEYFMQKKKVNLENGKPKKNVGEKLYENKTGE